MPLASLFGVAGVFELILGALIAVGRLARVAAFLAGGQMATAYFIDRFPHGFWPIQNNGEEAVFYCFFFLCMLTQGAGITSVDGAQGKG